MNCELPDVQAGFRKGRGTRDQIANICWIIKKVREFQKNIYFCFIDYAKAFDFVENSERDGNTRPPDLPLEKSVCRLVRTRHGTMDWFQIGKGVCQGCILSPCLFNLHAEYIMPNARLDEAQAGIKIAGRNINNLRYADDTTLMAESEEELKSLFIKLKEESKKSGLNSFKPASRFKNEDYGIRSHHFMANRWENNGNSERIYFLGLQNHCRW